MKFHPDALIREGGQPKIPLFTSNDYTVIAMGFRNPFRIYFDPILGISS